MKTITTFNLVDHGVEYPDYFQGCGVAFTSYANVATGIGDNPSEAIDDCLDMIAQGGIDTEGMEARIMAQEGLDELPVFPFAPDGAYYHVSIRWNDQEIAPAYIYCADIYCGTCGVDIMARLDSEGLTPDSEDYDSGDYPKSVGDDEESDCPTHCGSGPDCLEPTLLSSGASVGKLFGRLTSVGVDYVREAIEEGGEVAELWEEFYDV